LVWSYILVFYFDLGVIGMGIASCITYWSDLILVTLYTHFKEGFVPKESWHFFNADSFKGIGEFLEFGIPSALIYCLEWWSFEVLSVFAGMLSVEELAANIVLLNICILVYQAPEGIGFAISNVIGNSLGEMKARKSKKYAIISLAIMAIVTFVLV